MSDDIRDLLVEIAPEPSRRLDVDAIVAGGRRRRRARRGLAAVGALVVALALGGSVVAVSSGGGDTPLAVRAGSPPSSISAGWTPVTVDGAGISLAIPPGWTRAAAGDVTNEVLVVGTAPRPTANGISACLATSPAVSGAGTWVSLYEYPAGSTSLADPAGQQIVMNAVPPRPADFHNGPNVGQGVCSGGAGATNTFDEYAFTDAGRTFLARVATFGNTDPSSARLLSRDVLNTLHVDPATGAATTTTAGSSEPLASTTVPGVPPGVVPTEVGSNGGGFFNPTSADQQQIELAYLGWLRGKTLDEAALHIEDFASIRDAEAQGIAQHTPQDLAGFDGRVESVVIADPTHADVVYTVLHDGQPLYPNRPGKAVKVGGKWMVTRDTACALLSMGGITCPSRTTPTP
jgi:hypothetical protein